MKLTLHARIEIGIVAVLMLTSCKPLNWRVDEVEEKLELADVNARRAIGGVNAVASQVSDLESRIDDLERKVRYLE